MKNLIFVFLIIGLFCFSCEEPTGSKVDEKPGPKVPEYPVTEKIDTVFDYFGNEVPDPYFWLEDDRSSETEAWVKVQNKVTNAYLQQIPFRDSIARHLEGIMNYERYSAPFRKGEYYYYSKNDGLQDQSVMYYQKGLDGEAKVFLDPNKFSEDGTVALSGLSYSENDSLVAYKTATSGSDWNDIKVMRVEDRTLLDDEINWVKFSSVSWFKDGFFYATYDKPDEGAEYSQKTSRHILYYHKLGTPQSEDKMVFGHEDKKFRYIFTDVVGEEDFLIIYAANSTSGNAMYYKDLNADTPIKSIVTDIENDHNVVHYDDNTFYISSNFNAPNKAVYKVSAESPAKENWKPFIKEGSSVLESASFAGGKLFLNYLEDASNHIYLCNANTGEKVKKIELPALGSVGGFSGEEKDSILFYTFYSFTYPTTIYQYDVNQDESIVFRKPNLEMNPDEYVTKQVFYKSKDGTEVPMFIVHKKSVKPDSSTACYLYSYGGFNISLTPRFSSTNLLWLQNGGIYAMPNIRGGGEYGEQWHKAGTKMQKQNVFDDFIAAAEYLFDQGYTSPSKLTISGRSNGGLLVGATLTQRPDLAAVALPGVGVLDMLRYDEFTAGAGWVTDYGSAKESREMFQYLHAYSPVHNVKEGEQYPAILITTADHDDRVVPAHSFKFAAQLQEKQSGKDPVLIRIDTKAGHGGGKPISKIIDEWSDIFSFVYSNINENPYD